MKKPIAVLDNILVEKIIEDNKAGLALPEYMEGDDKMKPIDMGKVISVGHGIRRVDGTISPQVIKEGDVIYFSRYYPIKIEGKDYLVTKEVHVLLIIKDEKVKSTKS
jgi:co-chaperonin GroES (HSP10)